MGISVHQNGTLYLSAKEAGRLSGYTSDYVARLARQGKISATRVGTQWFVQPESLDKFLKSAELAKSDRKNKLRVERLVERGVTAAVSVNNTNSESSQIHEVRASDAAHKQSFELPHAAHAHAKSFVAVVCGLLLAFSYTATQFLDTTDYQEAALVEGRLLAYGLYNIVASQQLATQLLSAITVNDISVVPAAEGEQVVVLSAQHSGIVVLPSGVATSTIEQVKASFSDEVVVDLDAGGVSGVVTPQFSDGPGDQYRFVLVPVKGSP